MPLSLIQISAPLEEPVDINDVVTHIIGGGNLLEDEDLTYLGLVMTQVREYLETVTHLQFCLATWFYALDTFPCSSIISIPRPPLNDVTSIEYTNTAGVLVTLPTTVYGFDTISQPGRIYLLPGQSWPSTYDIPNAVGITYDAGYETADDVPPRIKQLLTMLIADAWRYRREISVEDMIREHPLFKRLLWSVKLPVIF